MSLFSINIRVNRPATHSYSSPKEIEEYWAKVREKERFNRSLNYRPVDPSKCGNPHNFQYGLCVNCHTLEKL